MSFGRNRFASLETREIPRHGATIHSAAPYLLAQSVQEVHIKVSAINKEEYEQGTKADLTHQMCLMCFAPIDTATCRKLDQHWAFGWHCTQCGYVKYSKEMDTKILMGAHAIRHIDSAEVSKYCVKTFEWVKDAPEVAVPPQLCMQLACAAQRGGETLRDVLHGAQFFANFGLYDILSRVWQREWHLVAVRLQDIIFIRHDKNSNFHRDRLNIKENKRTTTPTSILGEKQLQVHHFRLANTEIRCQSGTTLCLGVLIEHSLLENGEPVLYSSRAKKDDTFFVKNSIGRLLRMKMSGIDKIEERCHGDEQVEQWTKERAQALVECEPELEQRALDFLAESLLTIQRALPQDGQYCTIGWRDQELTVGERGQCNPNSLRKEFRETFSL